MPPAVTAQAATTSGEFNETGDKLTYIEAGKDVGSLNDSNHGLAIAYDGETGDPATQTYGKASATSNANVKVISGVLVLDAVPNFGFGSGASGSTVSLNPGQATTGDGVDGNDNGILQVTDARADQTSGATKGFTLNAQMANFSNSSSETAVKNADGFVLNLKGQELLAGDGNSAATGATPITTVDGASITSNAKDTAVMAPAGGTYKVGTLKASFDKADSASLYIPSGVATNDTANPSVQSLQSVITWTLDATPVTK